MSTDIRNTESTESPRAIRIPAGSVTLEGEIHVPEAAEGLVLFAHGSGSSRHSPRNQYVARTLREAKLGTLLFDLLSAEEEEFRRTTNAWYDATYTNPSTVDPTVYEANLRAAAWFRSSAAHLMEPLPGYLAILAAHKVEPVHPPPRLPLARHGLPPPQRLARGGRPRRAGLPPRQRDRPGRPRRPGRLTAPRAAAGGPRVPDPWLPTR